MKAIVGIREYIEQIPVGTPILASPLRGTASDSNIHQALCRMVYNRAKKTIAF